MMEEWKDIPGYEGIYQVSTTAIVKNKYGKILKMGLDKDGYLVLKLYNNGKKSTVGIHRAVALAFIPNPENKKQVNHLRSKLENTPDCLEWTTCKENVRHAHLTGRSNVDHLTGENHPNSKYNKGLINYIRVSEKSNVELGKELEISYKYIWAIRKGIKWKHT